MSASRPQIPDESSLSRNKEGADVTVISTRNRFACGDDEGPRNKEATSAHAHILRRCPYLAALIRNGRLNLEQEDTMAVETVLEYLYGIDYEPGSNFNSLRRGILTYDLSSKCNLWNLKNKALSNCKDVLHEDGKNIGKYLGDIEEYAEDTEMVHELRGERDFFIAEFYEAIETAAQSGEPGFNSALHKMLLTFANVNRELMFPETQSDLFESTFEKLQKLHTDYPDFATKLKETAGCNDDPYGFKIVAFRQTEEELKRQILEEICARPE